PSLVPLIPPAFARVMHQVWHATDEYTEQATVAELLIESHLVRLPVEERVGYLSGLSVDIRAPLPEYARVSLPDLGSNGADRYLRTVIVNSGYPKSNPGSRKFRPVRFALDILQG